METKYLSDGRKVVVIGKLNSQETIVQEIFVSTANGAEIPGGKNFVVNSLHDEPVLSYKEKQCEKTEKRIAELGVKEKKLRADCELAYEELKAISAVLKSSKKLATLFPEAELQTLTSFMTGAIEFLVVNDGYEIKPPVKMIKKIVRWDSNRGGGLEFDSIKLVSLLGKSNGDLEYRIHEYSDHSGGFTIVYPFTNLKDALGCIKSKAEEQIEKDRLTAKSYENCIKMGITFSDYHDSKYHNFLAGKNKEEIERARKKLSECQKNLDMLLEGKIRKKDW